MSAQGCPGRDWCTIPAGVEHDEYHAGDPIELADSDGSLLTGWWGWLAEDRPNGPLTVVIEGHRTKDVQIPAAAVAQLLAATSTPESRHALVDLLAAASVEVPS